MLALQPNQQGKPSSSEKETGCSQSSSSPCRCTPNILPCRIHHDGPLESTLERYWNPTAGQNGDASADKPNTPNNHSQTAYFRGRRLKGHRVAVPAGYEGILATQSNSTLPTSQRPRQLSPQEGDDGEDDEDEEEEEPVKILEKTATFDEFVVWSHERAPVASEDSFIRGVEEWVRFAEVMHSSPEDQDQTATTTLTSRNKISDRELDSN